MQPDPDALREALAVRLRAKMAAEGKDYRTVAQEAGVSVQQVFTACQPQRLKPDGQSYGHPTLPHFLRLCHWTGARLADLEPPEDADRPSWQDVELHMARAGCHRAVIAAARAAHMVMNGSGA